MINNNSFIIRMIDGLAKIIIFEIFSSKNDDSKIPPAQEKTQDIGYAIIVDDDGNEI